MAFIDIPVISPSPGEPNQLFYLRDGEPILFSEIFNGVPQLYAGSNFEVEEILEVDLSVTEPQLVDVDFRWYPPKFYLGTYSIFDKLAGAVNAEDRGFIEAKNIIIKRYSNYVIQANADVPVAELESGIIDNCNFQLYEVGIEIPPFAGAQVIPSVNDAMMKIRNSLQKVQLADRIFTPKIAAVGFYINPGVVVDYIKYTARIINGISVDLPAFPSTVCNIVPAQSCEVLFDQYLNSVNAPIAGNYVFLTQGAAIAKADELGLVPGQFAIAQQNYTCPISPFGVYVYWALSIITV